LVYLLLSAVLKGSRAELYQFICMFMVYFLTVNASFIFMYFRKYKLLVFSLGSIFLSVMIFVGLERGNDIFEAAFDYHTVGFALLSKYLGEGGMGHGISYGVSYFGGIDYIVGLLARLAFFGDFQSYSKMVLEYQNSMVTTFTAESQIAPTLEMYSLSGYNAFYTLLVTGVESFGSYGVMLLGGAFGFLIKYADFRAKKGDVFSAFYFVILISAVFMGIFASFLETVGFWLTLILLNVVFIACRLFDKPI
jgi:hypothetical protein